MPYTNSYAELNFIRDLASDGFAILPNFYTQGFRIKRAIAHATINLEKVAGRWKIASQFSAENKPRG